MICPTYKLTLESAVKIAQIIQGVMTPCIAVIIGYVTYRIQQRQVAMNAEQVRTQRAQHRLALMERRVKVYDGVMEFIVYVLQNGSMKEWQQLFKLIRDTREHHVLFGKEIGEYIDELYQRGSRLQALEAASGQGETSGEAWTEMMAWFSGQMSVAKAKFSKYMDFTEP